MQSKKPLGIIAGGGDLPLSLYEAALRQGWRPFLFGFHDNLHPDAPDFSCSIGQVGRLFKKMRRLGIQNIVLCGTFNRPNLWKIRFDLKGLSLLMQIKRALASGGDDRLLRGLIHIFEEENFTLPHPHDVAPSLLAPTGVLTHNRPTTHEEADIERGWSVIEGLSHLDIGQSCVVNRKRILAVEAIEGTEAMLSRLSLLPEDRRGSIPSGILVKRAKVGQDLRVDLPTIGPDTVEQARKAGLRGIVIEAGKTYILHLDRTIGDANRAGLFIIGR